MAGAAMGAAFRHLRGLFGGGSVVALEDGQLLARYGADGDEAAFEALIGRHGPMVLTICRAVLKNEHDVEDAFQATFLVLARKAGSVRGSEALGGWLHRVAYRASVRASIEGRKRRQREAEAATARRDSSRPESGLAALLHEEIDRLPGSLRLPVVLCDLEGLSYEEAAGRLGWTVPSLRHRLSDGRRRLKGRLARRGALPLAVGATFTSKAQAEVPPALVRATVALASGSAPTAGVALLAHTLLKGMLMTKIKIAGTAALAALTLASAGVIAAGGGRLREDPKLTGEPKPGAIAGEAPVVDEPAGLVEVRGIVVDPEDKPVAGAKVWASMRASRPEATSGPDGRFKLRIHPIDASLRANVDDYPWVVASATGFGLGWTKKAFTPGPSGELEIRLVEEGEPIEGKIINLEGRPVAGARVQVKAAWVADRTPFASWIARAVTGIVSVPGTPMGLLALWTPLEVETGADGRFRLEGIGRDRVVTLLVNSSTIAMTKLEVIAYDGPEIRASTEPSPLTFVDPRPVVFKPRRFEAVVGPSRPIEGVVRDKDTGRGIAGLTLQAAAFDSLSLDLQEAVVATTDAEGRYRLLGAPTASSYRLKIDQAPGRALPYVRSTVRTPADLAAVGPVRLDVALKRGVMVRGRVTDKATARPVTGHVNPFVFQDNPSLADFPGYTPPNGRQEEVRTDPDGRFEVVTPPGRGLIAFRADRDEYVMAPGAESIAGYDPQRGYFPTRPRACYAFVHHAFAEVDLNPKAESATVDLQVIAGRTLDLAVVDPDGRPVDGLTAVGISPLPDTIELRMPSALKARGLDPSRPRRVSVYHDERKLVGSIWLKGDEVGPLTVRMVPWGTIDGRFLDAEGNPLAAKLVQVVTTRTPMRPEAEGPPRPVSAIPISRTDRDGRFRIEGVVPDLKYAAMPRSTDPNKPILNPPSFRDVTVAPGEAKDLGDLKPPPPKP